MKKLIILMVFLSIFVSTVTFAASSFFTTEQVLNKVLDTTENKLKTTASISVSTLEVTVTPYTNTIFKRITLAPMIDSGGALDFGTEVSSWVILNMAETAEIYIKFDAPATPLDFKVPAGSGIGGNSKVTNIHCLSTDMAEVQVIGYY